MNKKLVFVVQGEIEVDLSRVTDSVGESFYEISETIDAIRQYGIAEIVDVKLEDTDETN